MNAIETCIQWVEYLDRIGRAVTKEDIEEIKRIGRRPPTLEELNSTSEECSSDAQKARAELTALQDGQKRYNELKKRIKRGLDEATTNASKANEMVHGPDAVVRHATYKSAFKMIWDAIEELDENPDATMEADK